MSSIQKVKLNSNGVRNLLKSPEMMQEVKNHAYAAQSILGSGYEVTYMTGKYRSNAEVAAVTNEAKRENLKTNSILKAVYSS